MKSTKFQIAVRERARKETASVETLVFHNRSEVEQILMSLFAKKLWWVSKDDERRLLTLAVWSEKYSVSIGYILNLLVPYYQQRFQQRRRKDSRQSLPCRIPTLTGKASEWRLKEQIKRDFPNDEHMELQRQQQQNVLMWLQDERQNGEDEFTVKRKQLTDYEFPSAYLQSYTRRIMEARRLKEKQRQQSQKPYRNNPWT